MLKTIKTVKLVKNKHKGSVILEKKCPEGSTPNMMPITHEHEMTSYHEKHFQYKGRGSDNKHKGNKHKGSRHNEEISTYKKKYTQSAYV